MTAQSDIDMRAGAIKHRAWQPTPLASPVVRRLASPPAEEWLPKRRMEEHYSPEELSLAVNRGTIQTRPSKAHSPRGLLEHNMLRS